MRKKIFVIILVILLITGLTGCNPEKRESVMSGGRFTVVENNVSGMDMDEWNTYDYYIVVDNETGVLYIITFGIYRMAMTVLLNADGTPMTMEEYKK